MEAILHGHGSQSLRPSSVGVGDGKLSDLEGAGIGIEAGGASVALGFGVFAPKTRQASQHKEKRNQNLVQFDLMI